LTRLLEGNDSLYEAEGDVADGLLSLGQWLDHGEQNAVAVAADAARGNPILDLGVGAGRTTSLLSLLSGDYTGVEYSDLLVRRAQQAHLGVDIRRGDARDLSEYPRSHYPLVMFSYNGIDSVSHDDRAQVLSEVSQVLRPGGYFVYSTLNKLGPWFNTPPWLAGRDGLPETPTLRIRRILHHLVGARSAYLRWWTSWRRLRRASEDHGAWGLGPLGGPGAGLVVHWSTPSDTTRELSEVGFRVVAMFAPDGLALADVSLNTVGMFHVVAQKPDTTAEPLGR
jgi:SAM-dependent methyltransferase